MTCKDCIHEKICDNLIAYGLPWKDGEYPAEKWCDHFKNKADAVEVVRCKDCKSCNHCYPLKNKGEEAKEGYYCDYNKRYVKPNDYCSYGERSANGT